MGFFALRSYGAGILTDPLTGMEFVFVEGGCYEMGDTFGDGNADERPVHKVCVDSFWIGKYEVTQSQWQKIIGSKPSYFRDCFICPVESVSWIGAQQFIQKLNEMSGKRYRLPTEAEWEYAARSGGKMEKFAGVKYPIEVGLFAWYNANSDNRTNPVGEKRPNGLGLYDMSGNVAEWCQDWYDEGYYRRSPRDNPKGPDTGDARVYRGGSFAGTDYAPQPENVRISMRERAKSHRPDEYVGFRLVLPAN